MALWLVAAFACRLGFGLASNFWTQDERQVYLVGLQAFARHAWPYYGADIVWTDSRLPGALQGLLVSVPLSIAGVPESPIVLLNVLSFTALAGFAWYLTRRLPELPRWLVWSWLLSAPWTLHFSTHVINTSYILPGAIAFFIGFFEAVGPLAAGLIGPFGAWTLMGFGLLWLVQIHLSWVLLPAYLLVAAVMTLRDSTARGSLGRAVAGFVVGASGPALLLAPTLLRGGLAGTGGMERNVSPHMPSLGTLVTITAQFLSFASTETNRFVGLDTAHRLAVLEAHRALVPLVVVLLISAVVIPVTLLFTGIRGRAPQRQWPAVRLLAAATVLWVYVSYAFSIRETQAHAFYVTFPVATLFAMSCWTCYAPRRGFRFVAAAVLIVNAVFLAGLAWAEVPERSLYVDRALVARAIAVGDDRWLGERRVAARLPAALEPARLAAPAEFDRASAREDLHIATATWSRVGWGRVSAFDVTVRNDGRYAAYIDLTFRAVYFDTAHSRVGESTIVIREILEPGAERRWPRLVDNLADPAVRSATLEVVSAERVIPSR